MALGALLLCMSAPISVVLGDLEAVPIEAACVCQAFDMQKCHNKGVMDF